MILAISVVTHASRGDDTDPGLVAGQKIAQDLRTRGKYPEAIEVLTDLIRIHPRSASSYLQRSLVYFPLSQATSEPAEKQARLGRAIDDASSAIELDRENPTAWAARAAFLNDSGLYQRAIVDIDEAIRLKPRSASYWTSRSVYHAGLGQMDRVIEDAIQAIEIDPKDASAWNLRGIGCSRLGRHQEAAEHYGQAIRLEPGKLLYWSNRLEARRQLGLWAAAVEDATQAIRLDSKDSTLRNLRGIALFRLDRKEEAIADFTEAIRLKPDQALYWSNRANATRQLGRWPEVIADATRSIELDPSLQEAWNDRGLAQFAIGQKDRAIADFTEAIRLAPNDAFARDNRSGVYASLGRIEEALADSAKAIELFPGGARFWNNRAHYLGRLGRWAEARDDWIKVAELEPRNPERWNDLGVCYLRLRRDRDGVTAFSRAIEIDGTGLVYHRNRGAAYAELGEWERATADYRENDRLSPRSTEFLREFALLLLSRSDRDAYRRLCESALDRHGDSDEPGAVLEVARTCLLARGSLVLEDELLLGDLIRRVVARHPNLGMVRTTEGLFLLRAGQDSAALAKLDEARLALPGELRGEVDLALAVARHRLGQAEPAREALGRGTLEVERSRSERPRGPEGGYRLSWITRLSLEQALRETTDQISDH